MTRVRLILSLLICTQWPALYNTHWGFQHPSLLLPNEFLVGHTNNFDGKSFFILFCFCRTQITFTNDGLGFTLFWVRGCGDLS